ncbi:kinase-like protein [Meredithblackwellia eburnea MCA 4105]
MSQQNSAHSQNLIGHTIDAGRNQRLEFISILGLGAYGVVYLARDILAQPRPQPPLYAVKCLNKLGLDSRQRSFQTREIILHGRASHHGNVVTVTNVIEEETYIYVVMDFCEEGDLFGMITERQRYLGDDELIRSVFLQIIDALDHCHRSGIYHRDLKPENILCQDDGRKVLLADFGLATNDRTSGDFGCGSTFYMSPECQGGLFQRLTSYSTPQNDVWSLGVILVNLACGRNPWKQACPSDETFRAYLANPDFLRSILPISAHTNYILKRIFSLNPQARISLSALRDEIESVKTFTMTEDELRGATRATREAARAFANAGPRREHHRQQAVVPQEDEDEYEDGHDGYIAAEEEDDEEDSRLCSPPVSPINSIIAGIDSTPPTPTQGGNRAPPTPPQTPRRATRPPLVHTPPSSHHRLSSALEHNSSSDSLSPCPSACSPDPAYPSTRYMTPPQEAGSFFASACSPLDDNVHLPPTPTTLRRPRKIRPTAHRVRDPSEDSSSSLSGSSASQPPTPTYATAADAHPRVRVRVAGQEESEDQVMADLPNKTSITAYYPVFADWAALPPCAPDYVFTARRKASERRGYLSS